MPHHLDIKSTDEFTRMTSGSICVYPDGPTSTCLKLRLGSREHGSFVMHPDAPRGDTETTLTPAERDAFLREWCEAGHTVNIDGKPWVDPEAGWREAAATDKYSHRNQQAEAWESVFKTLCEVRPGLLKAGGTDEQNACNAICDMARELDEARAQVASLQETIRKTTEGDDGLDVPAPEPTGEYTHAVVDGSWMITHIGSLSACRSHDGPVIFCPFPTRADVAAMIAKAIGAKP